MCRSRKQKAIQKQKLNELKKNFEIENNYDDCHLREEDRTYDQIPHIYYECVDYDKNIQYNNENWEISMVKRYHMDM